MGSCLTLGLDSWFGTEWDQTSNDTSGAATMEFAAVFGASLEDCGDLPSSLEAYSAPRSAICWASSRVS